MSKEYEKETRTGLHLLQQKLNIAENKVEQQNKEREQDKSENRIMGSLMIFGVLAMNFIAPYFIGSRFFSTNFSPKIGPIDIVVLLIGGAFLWKGIKK